MERDEPRGADDDDRDDTPSKRETLAHLVPRVVVRARTFAEELGPVRDVDIRPGCVVVLFDSGVQLEFHGDGPLWRRLLGKVHDGKLVVAGDAQEESWSALAAEVTRWRTTQ